MNISLFFLTIGDLGFNPMQFSQPVYPPLLLRQLLSEFGKLKKKF